MIEIWQTKPLSSVIFPGVTVDPTNTPDKTFRYVDVSSVSNQLFEIESATDIRGSDAPSRARRQIRAGDVIFATIRPTLKRIAVVPDHLDGAVCSTAFFVFKPRPVLDGRFLFYYLFSDKFLSAMESLQTGASFPAVNDGQVKEQEISFPSLPEQKRIVAILDDVLEGIAAAVRNAEKNLGNARELFDSYRETVFENRGHDWDQTTLGKVCKFHGGSQPPKSVFSPENGPDKIRLIQIRDYKSDRHLVYIPKAQARRFCDETDVMIGRYGPPLFQILRGLKGAYNVALMKVVPNEKVLSKNYLRHFLRNKRILRYIVNASNRAAGQIGLNKETIEPYPIAVPTLDEQAAVVQKLEALTGQQTELERVYESKLEILAELKEALLQKAFAGELTTRSADALHEAAE